jgi:carbohydrate-selective porin OprB
VCCAATVVLWVPLGALASQLEKALDAGEVGTNYFEGALTGLYQNALNAGEDTGNYEVDLIGSIVLKKRGAGAFGDTDFVFWGFSVNNIGSLQSTGQMRRKSGLLWDTNDINVDSSTTQFGVFGIRQFFYDDHLELGVGKVFPGMIHTESPYTANNSETFASKIISSSAVGGYFEAIGLGANLKYWGNNWFVQGGLSDAKAESEFDFDSLGDGVFAWTAELGWAPRIAAGDTAVSVLIFRVDETPTLTRQNGWALAATHDFGESAKYGVFGRFTQAHGGEGIGEENGASALPLKRAAFAGFAWNQPLGRSGDQFAIAALYGQPTDFQRAQGFSSQYGIETYWKFGLGRFIRVLPTLQLLHNKRDDLETIIGIRAKISDDFARHFRRH